MMNSAVLELKEALERLTDYGQAWPADQTHGADAHGLGHIYQNCNAVSNTLKGANENLSDGWHTSAELFYKIFTMVQDSLGAMYKGISLFTDETYQAELGANKAVESANDTAKSILEELNALDNGETSVGSGGGSYSN